MQHVSLCVCVCVCVLEIPGEILEHWRIPGLMLHWLPEGAIDIVAVINKLRPAAHGSYALWATAAAARLNYLCSNWVCAGGRGKKPYFQFTALQTAFAVGGHRIPRPKNCNELILRRRVECGKIWWHLCRRAKVPLQKQFQLVSAPPKNVAVKLKI